MTERERRNIEWENMLSGVYLANCGGCGGTFNATRADMRFCSKRCRSVARYYADLEKSRALGRAHYRAGGAAASVLHVAHVVSQLKKEQQDDQS